MKNQAYSSHVNVMMWYIYKYTRGTLHYYRYSDEKYKALTPHEENMNIKKLKKKKKHNDSLLCLAQPPATFNAANNKMLKMTVTTKIKI